MTRTLSPYAEKLVSDYLRDDPDLAALVGRRVMGKTPGDTDLPWLRVTQLDGPGGSHDHLIAFYFQIDCYAGVDGGQPEANLLMRTARAVLKDLSGVHPLGVVSGVQIEGAPRIPDVEFEPARERYVISATVWAHS